MSTSYFQMIQQKKKGNKGGKKEGKEREKQI